MDSKRKLGRGSEPLPRQLLFEERDWRSVVDELDCPVLFVVSSQDWAEAEMARDHWPNMHVEILENTDHVCFVEDAERFNQVLGEFVESLPNP